MNASAGRLGYSFDNETVPRFSELDDVRCKRTLTREDGSSIPAGTVGNVLLVLGAGLAYEVEFGAGYADLLTVNVDYLEAASTSE